MSPLSGDRAAVLSLITILLLVFFRTVFNAKPISKLCRLANWDSVFQQYSNNSMGSCDPSLVQLLLPNYFLVAKLWHQFTLPLWNQYSGCGMPLIGDIQACVFAPLHFLLALFPGARTYNLILVGEVGLCLLGSYALARLLALERLPAIFAGLAYSFCPFILYYLELLSGTSQALLPALMASYVYAARFAGRLSILAATLVTATFVLSGHPESSLYGVVFACLLYFAVGYSTLAKTVSSKGLTKTLWFNLFCIGLLSLGLTAPALLPFIEFLSCGESYKYGDGAAAYAPWLGIVLNLIQPCYGPSSSFLGPITWVLLALSVLAPKRQRIVSFTLAITAFVALALIGRLGLLDQILTVRPLSYLITVYLIPLFLLLVSVLAGIGLQVLSRQQSANQTPRGRMVLRMVGGATIIAVLVPLCIFYFGINLKPFDFDQTVPSMHFEVQAMVLNIVLVLIFFVSLRLFNRGSTQKIVVWSAVLLNLIGSLTIARTALPIQPHFDFPKTQLTDFFASHPGRVLSVIEHVLKPNSNIVYGIPSLRVHNPMLPTRFADFAVLCGAQLDEFRNQAYVQADGRACVTEFVDLASVKYLVSQFKPLPARYKQIFTTSEGISVYENSQSLPEAYLVSSCRLSSSKDATNAFLQAASFDPEREVILETAKGKTGVSSVESSLPHGQSPMKALSVQRPSANKILIGYSCPEKVCLVLTDTFYPGWKATIDGKDTDILRANLLFRAVLVPAGEHNVSFEYDPLSFRLGVILAALSTLLIVRGLIVPLLLRPKVSFKPKTILKA
ncbi:MAG: YfhO family protein [Candidatus Obscuribacterales bacterium]